MGLYDLNLNGGTRVGLFLELEQDWYYYILLIGRKEINQRESSTSSCPLDKTDSTIIETWFSLWSINYSFGGNPP